MNWRRLNSVGLFAAIFLTAATAFGQETDDQPEITGGIDVVDAEIWSTSTSSTSTTLATGLGLLSMQLATGQNRQMAAFLRRNSVALQHDIYTGGGESSADLARLFEVADEDREAFGRLLFEERHRLAPLIEAGPIDEERARRFVAIIDDAIANCERLGSEGRI